jgi:DNA adenine methylase
MVLKYEKADEYSQLKFALASFGRPPNKSPRRRIHGDVPDAHGRSEDAPNLNDPGRVDRGANPLDSSVNRPPGRGADPIPDFYDDGCVIETAPEQSRHLVDVSPGKSKKEKKKVAGRAPSSIYLDERSQGSRVAVPRPGRRRIAFGWYGGKFSHLDWLLPLLPAAHHYCEPFAGSGAVLLNRTPARVETYNDVDGDVVNFFRTLRRQPMELARNIALTPFSREEFHEAIFDEPEALDELERARRFYIRARQARTGLAQTASLGRWANCKNTSRAGMSGVISRWLGGVEALPEIGSRLLRVQIENRPALDVIRLYDSPTTLFYCDPPYLHDTRGDRSAYGFEMDEIDHVELSTALHGCQAKVAISGYRNDLMDKLYAEWRRFDAQPKQCHSIKKIRQECVWMNY